MPTFSSKQYEWSDISINILGRTLRNVIGVKCSDKVEKSFLYGRGNSPLGIQSGNRSIEGELTIQQSEMDALQAVAKTAGVQITGLSFDIVVAYAKGTSLVTDIIKGVEITDFEKGMKQGDKSMEISLKFMALDVQYGV